MKKRLRTAAVGIALLLAATGIASADDTHHADQPANPKTVPAAPGMPSSGMPMWGAQGPAGMMSMMNMMSQAGMTPMMTMMGPNGMMAFGMMDRQGQSAMMMAGPSYGSMGVPSAYSDLADHIEGRIAFLKAELKITEAETPQWKAYADALRKSVAQAGRLRAETMQRMALSTDLPARLASQEQLLRDRLDLLHQQGPSLLALYAALSEEQKRTADQLLAPGGMGM